MKTDYSRFKKDINLTRYAAAMGYEIDRAKSTGSSVAMKHSNGDKIIISKRGNIWVYFCVYDDLDNGTIIDFISKRTGKSIGEIGRELDIWLGGGISLPPPKDYVRKVQEHEFDPQRVELVFKRCRMAVKHRYLAGRGITGAVLSSSRFAGRVFSDCYQNAAFPHYAAGELCGLELKSAERAVFVRGSKKTFWRSNVRAGDNTLVISEAVIDALSYHQMFPTENSLYVATGGGMSPEQARIIREFITGFSGLQNIISITDNDQGGDKLHTKLVTVIEGSKFPGQLKRHSPMQRGMDWNDVLTA